MNIFRSAPRGTKVWPYTLSEQEYRNPRRILATDLAKTNGLLDWVPVLRRFWNHSRAGGGHLLAVPAG